MASSTSAVATSSLVGRFQAPLIRWCNDILKNLPKPVEITDLSDLGTDGCSLISLTEVLSGKPLKHSKINANAFAKSENVHTVIKFLTSENVQVNNVISTDIVKGDRKHIFIVVSALVFRYQIGAQTESRHGRRASAMAASCSSSLAITDLPHRSLSPTPEASFVQEAPNLLFKSKSLLLQWVQLRLTPLGIRNFTTDWTSGIALCGLVEFLCPGTFPNYLGMDVDNPLRNLRAAIDAAHVHLQVPKIIEPEEFSQVDEVCVMCYVSYFRNIDIKRAGITISSPTPDHQELPMGDPNTSQSSKWGALRAQTKQASFLTINRHLQINRQQEEALMERLKATEQTIAQLSEGGVGDPAVHMDSAQKAAKLDELKKTLTAIRGELVVLRGSASLQNWNLVAKEVTRDIPVKSQSPSVFLHEPTKKIETPQEKECTSEESHSKPSSPLQEPSNINSPEPTQRSPQGQPSQLEEDLAKCIQKYKRLKQRRAQEQRVTDALKENQLQQLADLKKELAVKQSQFELICKEKDTTNEQVKTLQDEREKQNTALLQATQQAQDALNDAEHLRDLIKVMEGKLLTTEEEKTNMEKQLRELRETLEKSIQLEHTRESELQEARGFLALECEKEQILHKQLKEEEDRHTQQCEEFHKQFLVQGSEAEHLNTQLSQSEKQFRELSCSSQKMQLQMAQTQKSEMELKDLLHSMTEERKSAEKKS
ncbi:hypothetical protein Pelo_4407 [Pelomyxa schiedti]|nr:hypothetical protein Pelo_4407 [Pelomyxa schiedti]